VVLRKVLLEDLGENSTAFLPPLCRLVKCGIEMFALDSSFIEPFLSDAFVGENWSDEEVPSNLPMD
jgi:hypothetical protein